MWTFKPQGNNDWLMHYGRKGMKWGKDIFGDDEEKLPGRPTMQAPLQNRQLVQQNNGEIQVQSINANAIRGRKSTGSVLDQPKTTAPTEEKTATTTTDKKKKGKGSGKKGGGGKGSGKRTFKKPNLDINELYKKYADMFDGTKMEIIAKLKEAFGLK